jgi:hypothetical protein
MVWVSGLEQVPRRRFYACNEFWAWHYFSGFAKEAEGNDYALFFGTDSMGYDPKSGGYAFLPAVISISPGQCGNRCRLLRSARLSGRCFNCAATRRSLLLNSQDPQGGG